MDNAQPGMVITPGGPTPPQAVPPVGAPEPERPAGVPVEPDSAPAPTDPQQARPATHENSAYQPAPSVIAEPSGMASNWFHPQTPEGSEDNIPDDVVAWTAQEFIEHPKNAAWYSLFALGAFAVVVLTYVLTGKDLLSMGASLLCVLAFGYVAARKPRQQRYTLNAHGIQVGTRVYSFGDFRTFSIAQEGAVNSIILMPLKRFMLPLTLTLDPHTEDAAVDYLAARLPLERHKPDMVEGLLRRIHF